MQASAKGKAQGCPGEGQIHAVKKGADFFVDGVRLNSLVPK